MKKRIQNYAKKLQANDKKGFSLIELIIVMAIMAILVGIVASQVLPYIEKSRQKKDQQILSSVCTDVNSAIATSAITCQTATVTLDKLDGIDATTETKVSTEFCELRSASNIGTLYTSIKGQLKSKLMKGDDIYVAADAGKGKVTVFANNSSSMPSKDIQIVETE